MKNQGIQGIHTGDLLKLISILLPVIRDERSGVQMISTAVILKGWIHREKIYVQVDFVDANLREILEMVDFSSFFVQIRSANCRTKFTFALPTSRASISVLITTAARSIKCWPERLNCPIISSRNAS